MESWCFDSMDKGFVSNETISPSHSNFRNKNVLMGWELKPPFSYENSVLVPIQKSVHNSSFPEVGIADIIRKQFPHDSTRHVLSDNASVGDIINPGLATSNAISGDEESSSKFSSSVMDSSSRESSLIDLKLGGFGDKPDSNSTSTSNVLSSADSSTPSKRARVKSLSAQTAYCQVYGCQKDLCSAKDYHRRHKVCDVHSKTAKVIVNGVEQRFCQQCSRFHLLGEFDDVKRSCRKRLAGHNERRRKPQVGFSNRSGRLFHSYTGSNFQWFTPASTSYSCQGILPRGTSHADIYMSNDWVKNEKVENAQRPMYNCLYGQLQPKSNFSSSFEKHFPFPDDTNNASPQSVFGKNVIHYTHPTASRSLFHANSPGSEDLTPLDVASTIEGIPGISESGCALSLLSSQLRKSSGHLSQNPKPEVHPLITPSGSPHCNVNEVSEKFFGIQDRNSLCRANSMGRNQRSSMLTHNNADNARSDFGNVMDHNSKLMNTKDHWSFEVGTTIDLLQLSSQLQRVENKRQPEPLKQESKVSAV